MRALLTILALTCACSSGATTSTGDAGSQDVPIDAGNPYTQGYHATLTFHGGNSAGQVIALDRALNETEVKTAFAFGSSHKQPPAISLGVHDRVQQIVKGKPTPLDVIFEFGNLIGSTSDPLQLPAVGTYPFGCHAPMLQVQYQSSMYRSTCAGLPGEIVVTDWSHEQGGRFAGHFHGTLHVYYLDSAHPDDCVAAVDDTRCTNPNNDATVDIDGVFGFTLPAPDGKETP
jgi:hypothetical protein